MSSIARYAGVIIDISHEKVDRPFQYRIPERLRGAVAVGTCVRVPFGRGDHLRTGYVIALSDAPEYDPARIKEIAGIAAKQNAAEGVSIRLAAWMRAQYGTTMITALKTVLPARKKMKTPVRRYISLRMPLREAGAFYRECARKKQYARERLLKELLDVPGERLPYALVTGKLHVTAQTIRSLAEKGVIQVSQETRFRNPVQASLEAAASGPADAEAAVRDPADAGAAAYSLSDEQRRIVDTVLSDYDRGVRSTYLIHGITGSGKTEVYINLIEGVVARGRQAIVLIPEIALTFQTMMRFYRHFGERVSVVHSMLSQGERYDQYERARNGELDVIIGPRSALFTPFPRTGMIIIDEEHEPTYKSETAPKYHARETAIALASFVPDGASVVLGSATPSLEAYDSAKRGAYRLFTLTRRLTGGALPEVEIVDLRDELREGNRSVFSRPLQRLLQDRLANGEQSMLFINRRGLAGFVSCRACGHVFGCPHCDVALAEHRGGRLVCHYCGYEEPVRRICPSCGSNYVSAFRAGTQQIENEMKRLFPEARVLRMDADTTRKKGDYERILAAFANREADVLVGTQMIVKGHDFPNVTLVGVLAADMSLYAADYRAAERTFQLLTQAAGRAGRGSVPGRVVIQTYQPEHYAIRAAASQNYEAFYEEEIGYRRIMMYPPAAHMLAVQIFAAEKERGEEAAGQLRRTLEEAAGQQRETPPSDAPVIIGPAPAAIGRIGDVHRMAIYVKDVDRGRLIFLKDRLENFLEEGRFPDVQVQFDFDPMSGF